MVHLGRASPHLLAPDLTSAPTFVVRERRLIGRWRIVESDLWDRVHLDLSGPATLTITARGGEIAFGALEAGLEVEYARDLIGFHWAGCEEGDEVEGEGTAELLDDGTIEIEFAYRTGDEAVLKAKRDPSSTAC